MKEANKPKILFLSAWYPNRYDEMWGLFVKNHAIACSKRSEIAVLYVHPKPFKDSNSFEIEISNEPFLTVRVYYPSVDHWIGMRKIGKFYCFLKAYHIGFKQIQKQFGDYDLIHANILTRTGVIAYFKKLFSGKKYIVTEHWSRYLPRNNSYNGIFRKLITRWVVRNASAITTVTQSLKDAMEAHALCHTNFRIIQNVVDTEVFVFAKSEKSMRKRILHVSCFEDKSKNISGILRVFRKIQDFRNDFVLILVGDGLDRERLEEYSKELGILPENIEFKGLLTGNQLVSEYQASSFMILFSFYETFGVVLAESLACGKPVIATQVGGIPEFINSSNGILVTPGDEIELEQAVQKMLNTYQQYSEADLRENAIQRFSMEVVGKQFFDLYSEVFSKGKRHA